MVRVCQLRRGAALRPNSSLAGVARIVGLGERRQRLRDRRCPCPARPRSAARATARPTAMARRAPADRANWRRSAPSSSWSCSWHPIARCAAPGGVRIGRSGVEIPAYNPVPAKLRHEVAAGAIRSVSGSATGRDCARAAAIGVGQAGGGVAKQVGFAAGEFEQPSLGRRVQLDRAVGADMSGRQSARGERAARPAGSDGSRAARARRTAGTRDGAPFPRPRASRPARNAGVAAMAS